MSLEVERCVMKTRSRSSRRLASKRKGKGIVNTLINKLPVELHLPGYRFCGPGTRLKKRLLRGDKGINALDEACKEHDIAYSQSDDLVDRHNADRILAEKAWERVRAKDASFGEKAGALTVAGIMKAKVKTGMGGRRKRRRSTISFKTALNIARKKIGGRLHTNILRTATMALNALKHKNIKPPKQRILAIPKKGGFLPLIPLFAALGALGSVGGGAAAIAKAVNDAKTAKQTLEEAKRHNKAMETASIGKGLYLTPYKKGLGLYLKPFQKNYQ